MANRGPSYGLSRECQIKTLAKFDVSRAQDALRWVEEVLDRKLEPSSQEIENQHDVRRALKSGVALCELMNRINPGAVKRINNSSIAFKEMENIEFFLKACKQWGMKDVDAFQTQDLYDTKSMYSAAKNGFDGPRLGVKFADENKRDFAEETLIKGNSQLTMREQAITEGASQKGMTPYGMPRKM